MMMMMMMMMMTTMMMKHGTLHWSHTQKGESINSRESKKDINRALKIHHRLLRRAEKE